MKHPSSILNPPRIHCTPEAAVAERVCETIVVEGRTFRLERPAGLDRVFDHPAVRAAYAADEYIPYWTDLWASARLLAKAVLRERWSHLRKRFGAPLQALEVGCGLGLGGIAAMTRGLHVTFSDCDQTAIAFAEANARLNGLKNFRSQLIDLRSPPADLHYPVIFGSDVMYSENLVEPLALFIARTLAPGGVALITDPDRQAAKSFRWRVQNCGLQVTPLSICVNEAGNNQNAGQISGTLYRISRSI